MIQLHKSSVAYQWWCKRCNRSHSNLYIDTDTKERYCDNCIPNDLKKKAKIYINGELKE